MQFSLYFYDMKKLILIALLFITGVAHAQTRQTGGISFTPQWNYKISGSDTTWQFGNTLMSPQQFPYFLTNWQSDRRYVKTVSGGYLPIPRYLNVNDNLGKKTFDTIKVHDGFGDSLTIKRTANVGEFAIYNNNTPVFISGGATRLNSPGSTITLGLVGNSSAITINSSLGFINTLPTKLTNVSTGSSSDRIVTRNSSNGLVNDLPFNTYLTPGDSTTYRTAANSMTLAQLHSNYQPLNAKLTSIASLANSNGVLTNNGSGVFSYTTPSTGTVSTVSVVTANGVSGSVANATTTPAITLSLGAITPTSTNGVSATTMAFNDATSSIQTQLNGKQASLGFTPENVANKATTYGTVNNTLYPTIQLMRDSTLHPNKNLSDVTNKPTALTNLGAAAIAQTMYVGTTAHAINRASASESLTGITSIDGSAAKWTTGRTVSITGDISYTSPSIDGSGNVTAAATLPTINSNVGTFNTLTVNGKGQVTAASNTSYQSPISLTTTGNSGASTFASNTLNVPNYTLSGLGGVPTTTTVNGKALSGNITLGLASSDFANQGTTTTVLHGNAAGNPSFSAVSLTADVTGLLPDGNINSATNWNSAYTNRITSLTTTGNSGAATLSSNVLNIPTYTLTGLGGISSTSTDVLTNKSISGSTNTLSNIGNSSLTNSTISGVSLGSTLFAHAAGYGLSGGNYTGAAAQTWTADTTSSTGLMSKSRAAANYATLTQLASKQAKIPTIIYADNYTDSLATSAFNNGAGINTGSAIVKAINAAHALGGGVVVLSAKTYLPTGYSSLYPMNYDNITIQGIEAGYYASDAKSITGGTIISGGIYVWANNFSIGNVGFDCGKTVSDTYYAGAAVEPFVFSNPSTPGTGDTKSNFRSFGTVRTLCAAPTTLAHSFLIENVSGGNIGTVETLYGIYGTVLKSQDIYAQNIIANGHAIIIKSDAVSNNARGKNITVNNMLYRSIPPNTSPYLTPSPLISAIQIDAAGQYLENVSINNISAVDSSTNAVVIFANSGASPIGINLGNVLIKHATRGVFITGTNSANKINVENLKTSHVDYPYVNSSGGTINTGDHVGTMVVDTALNEAVTLLGTTFVQIDHLQINKAPYGFNIASGSSANVGIYMPYNVTALQSGTGTVSYGNGYDGTLLNNPLTILSSAPQLILKNTLGVADVNTWDMVGTPGGAITFRAVNDANSAANIWMQVNRIGYVPTGILLKYPLNLTALAGSGDRVAYLDAAGNVTPATVGTGLSLSGGILSATGGISGSGTTGYIPKWTGSSSQGNSIIQEGTNTMSMGLGAATALQFSKDGTYNNISLNNSPSSNTIGLVGGGTGDANLYVNAGSSGDVVFRNNSTVEIGRVRSGGVPTSSLDLTTKAYVDASAKARGLVTSAAGTLTLAYDNHYTFTGTTATYTLPTIASLPAGKSFTITIKNHGSGSITVQSGTGNEISTNSSGANFSTTVTSLQFATFTSDGTYWNTNY